MHRIAALLVCVLSSFLALSAQAITVPGTTDGAFDVSPSGAATYNIPIKIVPGIAGMQPQLSISYSHQGGVGNLGVGFNLSGLSQITRCKPTIATEGYTGAIEVSAADSFCLDGQKLIPADPVVAGYAVGACLNGETPTHYHTEIESFSRIVSCGTQGQGPRYFLVWTKSGLVMQYGVSNDSRLEVNRPGGSIVSTVLCLTNQVLGLDGLFCRNDTAIVWAQNKVLDTKGNYYETVYAKIFSNEAYGVRSNEVSFYPQYIKCCPLRPRSHGSRSPQRKP